MVAEASRFRIPFIGLVCFADVPREAGTVTVDCRVVRFTDLVKNFSNSALLIFDKDDQGRFPVSRSLDLDGVLAGIPSSGLTDDSTIL